MAEKKLYPKPSPAPRPIPSAVDRPWAVKFDLVYDGGAAKWIQYYRTKTGARFSAWWKYHISSWGGSAVLIENTK